MSVVVAHQASPTGTLALQTAAEEAQRRSLPLAVVHVAEGLYPDLLEAQTTSVHNEIAAELAAADLADTAWTLTVNVDVDVAETVLDAVAINQAELLVIGARRRSPVGKQLLGSLTQQVLLRADVPVLVVKTPPAT